MGRRNGRDAGSWTAQLNRMPFLRRALLLMALAPACVWAADKAPDPGLLEFLGSLDAEGSGWSDYLENTDLGKVAKPARPAKPATPAPAPSPPPERPPAPPPARPPENAK